MSVGKNPQPRTPYPVFEPDRPMVTSEPEDQSGMALLGRRQMIHVPIPHHQASAAAGSAATAMSDGVTQSSSEDDQLAPMDSDVTVISKTLVIPAMSRTTMWRHQKAGKMPMLGRKIYTCSVCKQPMASEGHTQVAGRRYCPHKEVAMPLDQWMTVTIAEVAAKKTAKKSAASTVF